MRGAGLGWGRALGGVGVVPGRERVVSCNGWVSLQLWQPQGGGLALLGTGVGLRWSALGAGTGLGRRPPPRQCHGCTWWYHGPVTAASRPCMQHWPWDHPYRGTQWAASPAVQLGRLTAGRRSYEWVHTVNAWGIGTFVGPCVDTADQGMLAWLQFMYFTLVSPPHGLIVRC